MAIERAAQDIGNRFLHVRARDENRENRRDIARPLGPRPGAFGQRHDHVGRRWRIAAQARLFSRGQRNLAMRLGEAGHRIGEQEHMRAEIGAMQMNQEIDAMEVMGVDPFDALVLPRFIALVLMIPLLTLVAMAAGLAGGLLVLWPVLDLSPQFFLSRIVANVGPTHFWIGMAKAPVMAIVVAAIGCRHGFEVRSDVEQLGRHVTSAVVQALFAIIAIDALFALMFMELNL